jgi:hypothetical protein
VDIVCQLLVETRDERVVRGTVSWVWDVTRLLLNASRRVVCCRKIPVAGFAGDQGFLATLILEVLEPGRGAVFHHPQDAFVTNADEAFVAAMRDAWKSAGQLAQAPGVAIYTQDGRWQLRRGGDPEAQANDRSASGAAARGWWCALTGKVPDEGLIVLAQVDPEDVQRLQDVEGVRAKTQAIAADGRFDTIVVASTANQNEAQAALQEAGQLDHIRVVDLGGSDA